MGIASFSFGTSGRLYRKAKLLHSPTQVRTATPKPKHVSSSWTCGEKIKVAWGTAIVLNSAQWDTKPRDLGPQVLPCHEEIRTKLS